MANLGGRAGKCIAGRGHEGSLPAGQDGGQQQGVRQHRGNAPSWRRMLTQRGMHGAYPAAWRPDVQGPSQDASHSSSWTCSAYACLLHAWDISVLEAPCRQPKLAAALQFNKSCPCVASRCAIGMAETMMEGFSPASLVGICTEGGSWVRTAMSGCCRRLLTGITA